MLCSKTLVLRPLHIFDLEFVFINFVAMGILSFDHVELCLADVRYIAL